MALVLLGELRGLADPRPLELVLPILSAAGFTLGVGAFAVFVMPRLLNQWLLPRLPADWREGSLLGLVFAMAVGLMTALNAGGASYVLGAFLSGLCFCTTPGAMSAWHGQVKRIGKWLLRLFFACTVGFQVPISTFWSAKVRSRSIESLRENLSGQFIHDWETFWSAKVRRRSRGLA